MAEPRALEVITVGASTAPTCGVRDYAELLGQALGAEHVITSQHWLQRAGESPAAARASMRVWRAGLSEEITRTRPDAVVLHYSVFSYSYRGFPIFVPGLLSLLRRSQIPLVTVLHEYAYPWGRGGVRGAAWAASQRAVLFEVMRASAAVVLTTDSRTQWLASRLWLPHRPTIVAPVFSNLPRARAGARPQEDGPPLIGLFGYSYGPTATALVLDALGLLERGGVEARAVLIGAPGRDAKVGEEWLAGARNRGLAHAPAFSGVLPAQELADRLAECEILLSADPSGPSSRKTTLAASLSSGRPVIALAGPRNWTELIEDDAVVLAQPQPSRLAQALADLLQDGAWRERLGAHGREFATRRMSAGRSAQALAQLLRTLLSAQAS